MDVSAGTIVVWADIACPWATLALHRLHTVRERLELVDRVRLDIRAFPLELHNQRATPKLTLDAEVPVVGERAPDFGFQVWTAPAEQWPVSTLLALEAVQAAKTQSLEASEELDLALRRAMFAESRCISLRHVIMEAADDCNTVDLDKLAESLDHGTARSTVMEQFDRTNGDGVDGSPHLFLPDGSDYANPGIELHWEGKAGEGGFPVVDADDPEIYERILEAAAGEG